MSWQISYIWGKRGKSVDFWVKYCIKPLKSLSDEHAAECASDFSSFAFPRCSTPAELKAWRMGNWVHFQHMLRKALGRRNNCVCNDCAHGLAVDPPRRLNSKGSVCFSAAHTHLGSCPPPPTHSFLEPTLAKQTFAKALRWIYYIVWQHFWHFFKMNKYAAFHYKRQKTVCALYTGLYTSCCN